MPRRHTNYFMLYDKTFGDRLMVEAQARGLNRTAFVRAAVSDYLSRNPIAVDRNYSSRNLDNAKK